MTHLLRKGWTIKIALTLGLLASAASTQSVGAQSPRSQSLGPDKADSLGSVALLPKWAFCTGSSDAAVYSSDVFKVRSSASLTELSDSWTRFLTERYQASGSCQISFRSKSTAYTELDSAISDVEAHAHVYRVRQTGWVG